MQQQPQDADSAQRGGQTPPRARPLGFMPGHVLVSAALTPELVHTPLDALERLVRAANQVLQELEPKLPQRGGAVPVVVPAARGGFLVTTLELARKEPRAVREAVTLLNSPAGRAVIAHEGLVPSGATPNWFGAAQQDCVGGSPGSDPSPVEHPRGKDLRYVPSADALNGAADAESSTWARTQGTHVAILDTAPTWQIDPTQYSDNHLLAGVLGALAKPVGSLANASLDGARQAALAEIESTGHFYPSNRKKPVKVQDHGLFVASVIHATAPWANLRLVRVLNDYGVGTLELLLLGLAGVAGEKPGEPLVINLSLGMLPPWEQLPALWDGSPIPNIPDCPADPSMGGAPRGRRELEHEIDRLQRPIEHMLAGLVEQNCLVVAAAGNDSLPQTEDHDERWQPRVPARYDTVLGVAATSRADGDAAPYSNRGDLTPPRDAVAIHGGDLQADHIHPRHGVIGVYSADKFPDPERPNHNGWAEWSGTSFATAIASGVAANVWATQLDMAPFDASTMLDVLNDDARLAAPLDVAGLLVPAVPVHEEWIP